MNEIRINPDVVREELFKFLGDMEYFGFEGKAAEQQLACIAGAYDMALAIIERCEGGNKK